MKEYSKHDLIFKFKKEEDKLIYFCNHYPKNFVVGYICKTTNCNRCTADWFYRRIMKYGKI